MVIMRGDATTIPVDTKYNGQILTPDIIADIELSVEDKIAKLYSSGEVWFDKDSMRWNFRLSQEETFNLRPAKYGVIARIKFPGAENYDVNGFHVGEIIVMQTYSKRVL
jgi:hypothetical protein